MNQIPIKSSSGSTHERRCALDVLCVEHVMSSRRNRKCFQFRIGNNHEVHSMNRKFQGLLSCLLSMMQTASKAGRSLLCQILWRLGQIENLYGEREAGRRDLRCVIYYKVKYSTDKAFHSGT